MGIYIFSWKVLKEALVKLQDVPGCDFGKHIIPYCHEQGKKIYAYEYNGYWKDVGTLSSYWEANMELIDIIPEFNLYEEYWKIYTKSDIIPPQYIAADAKVERSIIGEGSEIYGRSPRIGDRRRRYCRKRRGGDGFHRDAGEAW